MFSLNFCSLFSGNLELQVSRGKRPGKEQCLLRKIPDEVHQILGCIVFSHEDVPDLFDEYMKR